MLVQGANAKVYTCSNASWVSEDGDVFELSKNATCSFRIWGNCLRLWGKRGIGVSEVRSLLRGEDVKVRLFSKRAKTEYFKYIALNEEYGVSVLWDIDIDED